MPAPILAEIRDRGLVAHQAAKEAVEGGSALPLRYASPQWFPRLTTETYSLYLATRDPQPPWYAPLLVAWWLLGRVL